ncbi:unnamed protein product [Linum tenue]|uniref:SecA Wing/Scaffold domain-containing protein n=1 Tax=Linum tenue TaxID=586396 RepID=A0AAV0RXV6_9ROSI|nr:unnamed protein product [Linum tenue]
MQAIVDDIVFHNADPQKHPRNWNLGLILKEYINIGGNLLDDAFAGITEEALLESLTKPEESSSIDINSFCLPNMPKPPNSFRGIRKKCSSLKRWLCICSDDSYKNGRYRTTTNLLRKYLGDFLIASYCSVIEESGYDDTYIREIEVNVRSFGHRNPLEEYKIDGCRFFISMLGATRRMTIDTLFQYWSSPMESQELYL